MPGLKETSDARQIQISQTQCEEEQRHRDEARELLMVVERRAQLLQTEKADLAMNYENVP